MRVSFYSGLTPSRVIPKLVEKAYDQEQRGVIIMNDMVTYQAIHDAIWTFSQTIFIPHGGEADKIPAIDQPFWLTNKVENPNGASICYAIDADYMDLNNLKLLGFERLVCVMSYETPRQIVEQYRSMGCDVQIWIHNGRIWQAALT